MTIHDIPNDVMVLDKPKGIIGRSGIGSGIAKLLGRSQSEVSEPEFANSKEAGKVLSDMDSLKTELAALDDADNEIRAELQQAEQDAIAKLEANRKLRAKLQTAVTKCEQARKSILAESKPSAEEEQLRLASIQKMHEAGELRARYRMASVHRPTSEAIEKHLEEKNLEVAELRKAIKQMEKDSPSRLIGQSAQERRLPVALREQREAQQELDNLARRQSQWDEINELKQEGEQLRAKRLKLQAERQEAAIKAATKRK